MDYQFRKATICEITQIWEILQGAIKRRKADGSNQWQDGYPNPEVILNDIELEAGYVLTEEEKIICYSAVLINDEPEYEKIKGKWLTNTNFVVVHRIAIAEKYLGKGSATKTLRFIEEFALSKDLYSIKADTNFDNLAMMKTFEKLGYTFCGEVYFKGSPRKAYEKILAEPG